jgi:hypothetical protein
VALAIQMGVKKIGLYGCDFHYPDLHMAESGRACVEFLIGNAGAKGINIVVANDSTLLDASLPLMKRLYGYHEELTLERDEKTKRIIVRLAAEEPQPSSETSEVSDELRGTALGISDNGDAHDRTGGGLHAGGDGQDRGGRLHQRDVCDDDRPNDHDGEELAERVGRGERSRV